MTTFIQILEGLAGAVLFAAGIYGLAYFMTYMENR